MTRYDQCDFILTLIRNVKEQILSNLNKYPEEWDGIELRWLIANKFSEVVNPRMGSRSRKRTFNNECIVKNL